MERAVVSGRREAKENKRLTYVGQRGEEVLLLKGCKAEQIRR